MVNEMGDWKIDELNALLPIEIINKIKALPPPQNTDGADERVWPGDRLGQFDIASAYKLLCGYRDLEVNAMWNFIWKLDVPERVRFFVWRLRYGRIPTNKACHRWGYGTPYCGHCIGVEENIIHALRDCPVAHHTWNHLLPMQSRHAFFTCHFHNWFQHNMLTREKMEGGIDWCVVWAVTCYHLWLWRNKETFDSEFVRPKHASSYIMQYVDNYNSAKQSVAVIMDKTRTTVNVKWEAPRSDWISLNTDGAVKNGIAGCGGVLRDHRGNWITGFSKYIGITSAFNAELWGVYNGLCLAKRNGLQNIELQIDSMIVVRTLSGDRLGDNGGRSLVRRIRSLFQDGWNIKIRHVYREANRVADALATLGCQQDACNLFEAPPLGVDQLCSFDSSGVTTPRFISM
jgi:ribonuclease HI